MLRWFLQRTTKTSFDVFIKQLKAGTKEEARDELLSEWNSMDPREQANTDDFYACLAEPAEDFAYHFAAQPDLEKEIVHEGFDPDTVEDIVNRAMVFNKYGNWFNFPETIQYMDPDLRELLTADLAPFTYQEFFEAYAAAHRKKFKKVWLLEKKGITAGNLNGTD